MEKPVALFMNCDEKSNTKSHLNKTFSEQLLLNHHLFLQILVMK